MKLINDTKKPKHKTMLFDDLEYGDVFEDDQGLVWIKTLTLSYEGAHLNAIRLEGSDMGYFDRIEDVYPLNATLHYERILEGE